MGKFLEKYIKKGIKKEKKLLEMWIIPAKITELKSNSFRGKYEEIKEWS